MKKVACDLCVGHLHLLAVFHRALGERAPSHWQSWRERLRLSRPRSLSAKFLSAIWQISLRLSWSHMIEMASWKSVWGGRGLEGQEVKNGGWNGGQVCATKPSMDLDAVILIKGLRDISCWTGHTKLFFFFSCKLSKLPGMQVLYIAGYFPNLSTESTGTAKKRLNSKVPHTVAVDCAGVRNAENKET